MRAIQRSGKGIVALGLLAAVLGPQALAAQEQNVSFVTTEWPPYYGPELENQGFTVVIAQAAFERVGYSYEVAFRPWSRAMSMAKAGAFDGLHGAFYSQERDQDFHISGRSLYTAETVLVAWETLDLDTYDGLRDLLDYKIGTYQDYAYPDPFGSAVMLDKTAHPNNRLNLRQLASGRLDLVAGGRAVLFDLAASEPDIDVDKLKVVQPPLGTQNLLMMVPKSRDGGKELLAAFDDGMAEIRRDGTYDDVLAAYNLR